VMGAAPSPGDGSASSAVAEAIPGAEYLEIERAGHFGYLEQPAEVNRVLVDFCGRHRD